MLYERLVEKARIFDLDDTLVERQSYVRFGGVVRGRLFPHSTGDFSLEEIAALELNHSRSDEQIRGLKAKGSFWFHARRKVYPGVKEALEGLDVRDVDLFIATGRSDKAAWVDMTEETLSRANILNYFRRIFYTPEGIKPAVSKAHTIYLVSRDYREVEFDEDDPRTALFLARLFPGAQINYRYHPSTALLVPSRILSAQSNIRTLPAFG